jgi:hypothetical protein
MWPFKKKSTPQKGKSMLSILRQIETPISTHACDKCGKTFMLPGKLTELVTVNASDVVIDVGGYCNYCQKYVCQKHVKFLSKGYLYQKYRLLYDSERIKNLETNNMENDMTYILVCETCETPLVPSS